MLLANAAALLEAPAATLLGTTRLVQRSARKNNIIDQSRRRSRDGVAKNEDSTIFATREVSDCFKDSDGCKRNAHLQNAATMQQTLADIPNYYRHSTLLTTTGVF